MLFRPSQLIFLRLQPISTSRRAHLRVEFFLLFGITKAPIFQYSILFVFSSNENKMIWWLSRTRCLMATHQTYFNFILMWMWSLHVFNTFIDAPIFNAFDGTNVSFLILFSAVFQCGKTIFRTFFLLNFHAIAWIQFVIIWNFNMNARLCNIFVRNELCTYPLYN